MNNLRLGLGLLALWFSVASLAALNLKTPPPNGIYDPGNFLEERVAEDLAYQIGYEKKNRNFEIFVIIFEEEPAQGALILAKQAGESWSTGEWWTVIFQVGPEGSPDCLAGGKMVQQLPFDVIERTLRGARNTALLVDSPQERMIDCVNNVADGFGFLYVKAKQNYEEEVEEFDKRIEAHRKKKETRRAIAAILGVVLLGLAALGFVLWKKHLRKMKPMEFPMTSPRRRLAAPFSGGGDVLVKYGRRH